MKKASVAAIVTSLFMTSIAEAEGPKSDAMNNAAPGKIDRSCYTREEAGIVYHFEGAARIDEIVFNQNQQAPNSPDFASEHAEPRRVVVMPECPAGKHHL